MAITMFPIHKNGGHQRSLQMMSINDAYTEVRRHADRQAAGKQLNGNVQFYADDVNPIVKFVIVNGDKPEVVTVKGFNRIRV